VQDQPSACGRCGRQRVPDADVIIERSSKTGGEAHVVCAGGAAHASGALLATYPPSLRWNAGGGAADRDTCGLHFFNPVANVAGGSGELGEHRPGGRRRSAGIYPPHRQAAVPSAVVQAFWSIVYFPLIFTRRCTPPGEGIAFAAIDRAAVDFGMPMGPIELSDVVRPGRGLPWAMIVTPRLQREPPRLRTTGASWCRPGRIGRKSGQGFLTGGFGKDRARAARCCAGVGSTDRLILVLVMNACGLRPGGHRRGCRPDRCRWILAPDLRPLRRPDGYARARGIDAFLRRLRELEASATPRFRPMQAGGQMRELARKTPLRPVLASIVCRMMRGRATGVRA